MKIELCWLVKTNKQAGNPGLLPCVTFLSLRDQQQRYYGQLEAYYSSRISQQQQHHPHQGNCYTSRISVSIPDLWDHNLDFKISRSHSVCMLSFEKHLLKTLLLKLGL